MARIIPTAAAKRVVRLSKPSARKLATGQRYDANIERILRAAASVFAEKSFGLASIRDIASRARISFPRIYYYLRSKEELLYLISRRAFEELISRAGVRLGGTEDTQAQLRRFIESHLEYHMANLAEMKVLVREADSLGARYAGEIARLKRDYSRLLRRILEELARKRGVELNREQSRIVTSLVFGAMNWFYTWYEPARDFDHRGRIIDEVYRLAASAVSDR
ncbi:MAG: TetR/AcrR family transcriptional regulator [Candidatus Binataceae bacterium]